MSPPFPSTSSSSHSSLTSCTSSCTSSTTLRAVATLRTSPERRWTLLTTPTSSQRQHSWVRPATVLSRRYRLGSLMPWTLVDNVWRAVISSAEGHLQMMTVTMAYASSDSSWPPAQPQVPSTNGIEPTESTTWFTRHLITELRQGTTPTRRDHGERPKKCQRPFSSPDSPRGGQEAESLHAGRHRVHVSRRAGGTPTAGSFPTCTTFVAAFSARSSEAFVG